MLGTQLSRVPQRDAVPAVSTVFLSNFNLDLAKTKSQYITGMHALNLQDRQSGETGGPRGLVRTGGAVDVEAIRATPEAKNGDVVVARFGDEVTLKRFVRLDARHVELRPDSHNPEHEPIAIDLAKHILHVDGVAVGALIGRLGSARD